MSQQLDPAIRDDVAAVQRIDAVRTILEILCEATGRRIALLARVTPESWTACSVVDGASFGLRPGDSLEVSTTF